MKTDYVPAALTWPETAPTAAYTLIQPAKPVAWQWLGSAHFRKKIPKSADVTAWNPLYTTPLQRPWVGLTDDEAQWFYDNCRTPSNLIDMVEAKLREKNT